jgi:hypothetical protein
MWETLSSFSFKLIREDKCFTLDVVRQCSKYALYIFKSEVIKIYFLLQPVNFVLYINLLGLFNGRSIIDCSFNFNPLILLIFLVGTK